MRWEVRCNYHRRMFRYRSEELQKLPRDFPDPFERNESRWREKELFLLSLDISEIYFCYSNRELLSCRIIFDTSEGFFLYRVARVEFSVTSLTLIKNRDLRRSDPPAHKYWPRACKFESACAHNRDTVTRAIRTTPWIHPWISGS